MSAIGIHFDQEAEQAVLGAIMLASDARSVSALVTRGLRPEHFYWDKHGAIFTAAISLAERASPVDHITISAELERLGLKGKVDRGQIEMLMGYVPSSGHREAYADRVIELARWRGRERAAHSLAKASAERDQTAWTRAQVSLESAVAGTRTESYSSEEWSTLLWDYYTASDAEVAQYAIPLPFVALNDALGGGLSPGESMALSGATNHGKSVFSDMCLDHAAKNGKRCWLYMTEMTAINRGLRYMARQTGVPFLRQRRRTDLTDADRKKILAELGHLRYGCSIVGDWDIEDIVHHAWRGRYDLVVIDLIHGFHYADERGLDRLSKAVQRLARVSTTLDGHRGTAVIAVTHLKEEGVVKGKIPRPSIASIKGGSSIKQDCDFVCFVWQEQPEDGPPTGEGEIWIPKPRSGDFVKVFVRVNAQRYRFDLRQDDLVQAASERSF